MKKNRALVFSVTTITISYLLVALYLILGGKWNTSASFILTLVYMFIPMFVSFILYKIVYKESIVKKLDISFKINRWFIVAWLLPVMIAFLTIIVSLVFPDVEFTSDATFFLNKIKPLLTPEQYLSSKEQITSLPINIFWIVLLQGLIAGISVNAIAGFGEELGWRGLLLKELSYMGFLKSSVVIGLIWGIWHMPIILLGHNYPDHPIIGVFMMIIFTLLLSPIFCYIRIKAKSVIAAAIIHGSLNATVGLAVMVVKGGNDLTIGVTGLAGFIVLFIINIVIFLYDKYISNEKIIRNWIG